MIAGLQRLQSKPSLVFATIGEYNLEMDKQKANELKKASHREEQPTSTETPELSGQVSEHIEWARNKRARQNEIMATISKAAVERKNIEIEKYRQAAEQGDAEAQYQLGLVYCEEFREQAVDDSVHPLLYPRPRLDFNIPPDSTLALRWFQEAAKQGHAKAQKQVEQIKRKQLVERLTRIAAIDFVGPFFQGACCYAIAPPSPVQSALYGLITQMRKICTNLCTSALQKTLPIPEEYQSVFALLQESGWDVSYHEHEEHKGVMVIRFPGSEDLVLEPIPDVSTLEMMARFLENDRSVTIEDIKKGLEDCK